MSDLIIDEASEMRLLEAITRRLDKAATLAGQTATRVVKETHLPMDGQADMWTAVWRSVFEEAAEMLDGTLDGIEREAREIARTKAHECYAEYMRDLERLKSVRPNATS